MPRRPTGTENRRRPALLQLVTAVALLAALALGAVAAAIFMAFPCPCRPPILLPNPKPPEGPLSKPTDGEKIDP